MKSINSTLEERIKILCKDKKYDLFISTKKITSELNFIYNSSYTEEEVNKIIGYLFEQEYHYKQTIEQEFESELLNI